MSEQVQKNTMVPISVFLVDDNPTFLRFAARFLQGCPEVELVGTASSGEDALTQFLGVEPQVVLVDLRMPGLSGFELIPRLQAAFPGVGVVALTLLDTDDYRQAALAAGADGFVSKGAMVAELVPAIQQASRVDRGVKRVTR